MWKALVSYVAVCGFFVGVLAFDYPADVALGAKPMMTTAALNDESRLFFQQGNTLNTSFAFTIPLFSITLPRLFGANTSPATNLGGIVFLIAVGGFLVIVLPLLGILGSARSFEDSFISNGLVGISETLMNYVDESLENLPKLPRMEAKECIRRSICEAHQSPTKYGKLGVGIQVFFPSYKAESRSPATTFSKYLLAARYGKKAKADCSSRYNNCMFPVLSLLNSFIENILSRVVG